MAKARLKIAKAGQMNLNTKTMGFIARVATRGKASYDDIVAEACHNTSLHKAEAKTALELCMETVVEMLKQGYIVELGPVGTLYPTCTGKWAEKAEDLQLDNVKPSIRYRPGRDMTAAIKEAKLQWARETEADSGK